MKVVQKKQANENDYHFSELGIGDAYRLIAYTDLHIKTSSEGYILYNADIEQWVQGFHDGINDDPLVVKIDATITYTYIVRQ